MRYVFIAILIVFPLQAAEPIRNFEAPRRLSRETVQELSILLGTGFLDAYSTNAMKRRYTGPGLWWEEQNPLLRPFAGHKTMYLAIPIGDLAIYGTLRMLGKRRAARWYAYGMSGAHLGMGMRNLIKQPPPVAIPAQVVPQESGAFGKRL